MNEEIMKNVGLGKEVHLVEEGNCPLCRKEINEKEFKDELSKREFEISGLCQECQDKIFGE